MPLRTPKNRIWIALALVLLLLVGCGAPSAPAETPAPEETAVPTISTDPPATVEPTTASDIPSAPASASDIRETPEPTPPVVTPPPVEVTPPPPGTERVDDTYFADAAFLGNSLMDGLRLYGGLKYGDFYAGTSASVVSVGTVRDYKIDENTSITKLEALLSKQYNKIYVLFGINEMGFNIDGFISIYSELLARISAGQPNAQIIVLSLTPITQQRDEKDELFTRERVLQFNEAIAKMATSRGYIYLNLYDAMADENGWLPENESTDGIHFTPGKYIEWAEFLRTHFYTEGETDIAVN